MHRSFISICLFFQWIFAYSQSPDQVFSHITYNDGLSYNHVNCLLRDSKGYMWIGTVDGLNRFDGRHFKVFRKSHESNSLPNNTIHSLAEDHKGYIWGATDRGIFCYSPFTNDFTNYYEHSQLSNPQIGNILVDQSGTVWANNSMGLIRLDSVAHKFVAVECPSALKINGELTIKRKGMVESPDGKGIWLATLSGLIYFDKEQNTFYSHLDEPKSDLFFPSEASTLRASPKGHFWYFEDGQRKLIGFDPVTREIKFKIDLKNQIKPGEIAAIFEDEYNQVWLSNRAPEIYRINYLESNIVEKFVHKPEEKTSLLGDFFWDGYNDENGTLWLGTVGGISRSNKAHDFYKVHRPFENSTVNPGIINRIFIDPREEDLWWFIFRDDRLVTYNHNTRQLEEISPSSFTSFRGQKPQIILKVIFSEHHRLIVANNGIWTWSSMGKFIPVPIEGLPDSFEIVNAIFNKKENLMITDGTGIWSYNFANQKLVLIPYSKQNTLNKESISHSLMTLMDDQVWMISGDDILSYISESTEVLSFEISTDEAKSINGYYTSIKPDYQDNLWIVRKGDGIFQYNTKSSTYKKHTQSDGLIMDHMIDVEVDQENRIWAGGFNQFSIYNPENETFRNINLPMNENGFGSFNNRMIKLQDGHIICTLGDKVVEFYPDRVTSFSVKSKPLISNVIVNGREIINNENPLRLKPDENNLQIQFGILMDQEVSPYDMEYQLNGLDNEWHLNSSSFEAFYNNLPSGNYTFKVRALAKDKSWISEESNFELIIDTPFYKTIWFSLLLLLVSAYLIYALYNYRVRQIEKTEKLKTEFNKQIAETRLQALQAQMNPHFIFNCLNSINRYIIKNDVKNSSLYLTKFAKLIRLILDNSKHRYVPLSNELDALKLYLEMEAFRFEKKFQFHIDIDDQIDPNEILVPPLIIQPYAENAIWHGLLHKEEEGELKIIIKGEGNILEIEITDNGIGREKSMEYKNNQSETRKSYGMKLTEERLTYANDSILKNAKPEIIDLYKEDGSPAGTKVIIKLAMNESNQSNHS